MLRKILDRLDKLQEEVIALRKADREKEQRIIKLEKDVFSLTVKQIKYGE